MRTGSQKISRVLNHKLFRSSLLYTLTDAVNKAVPFLLLPLLTHYLLPGEYGIVSNYNIYVYILSIFVGLNLNGLVSVNFYKMPKEQLAEYMFNVLFIILASFLICGIAIAGLQSVLHTFLPVSLFYLALGLFIALGQTVTSINLEFWQLEEKPLKFGVYQILQTLLNLTLTIIFLVVLKFSWEGRIYSIAIATLVFGLFSLYLLHRRGYLKARINKSYIIESLKFGIPLLPHTLSIWIRSSIDRILITKFYGVDAAGIYSTGFQFGLLISFLTLAFNNAYIPYLYRNLSTEDAVDLEVKKKKIVAFTYWYLAGLVFVAVLFILFSNLVVDILLDEQYRPAKKFIGWAIFSQTFQGMYLMFVCFIFYVRKTAALAWITFTCSLLQVLLSNILLIKFGVLGAAYSTIIVSFLNFISVWYYSNSVYKMPWNIFKQVSYLSRSPKKRKQDDTIN